MVAPNAAATLLVDTMLALVAMDMAHMNATAVLLLFGLVRDMRLAALIGNATALLVVLVVVLVAICHGRTPYTDENCVAPKNGATLVDVIAAAAEAVGVTSICRRTVPFDAVVEA